MNDKRPVAKMFGDCGAIGVTFNGDKATVTCRNGFEVHKGASDGLGTFETTADTGDKIMRWVMGGKRGCIQDVVPELDIKTREMCVSGITPDQWDDYFPPEDEDEEE